MTKKKIKFQSKKRNKSNFSLKLTEKTNLKQKYK